MKHSIVIVINALHSGGTEKTCIEIARHLSERYQIAVAALTIGGPAEQELRQMGARVEILGASNPLKTIRAVIRLVSVMRELRPEAILTFLYFSDLFGAVIAKAISRRSRIYWNVRNNVLARHQAGLSYYGAKLCAWASRFLPYEVVYCSGEARIQHEALGFRPLRSAVVENCAAAVPFSFNPKARSDFRRGRFDGEFVFLFIGRFDPVKRVDLYIEACARTLRSSGGALRFAIAGREMDQGNPNLRQMVETSGCAERFELLGFVQERERLYSAADCLIVTSETEGSPNIVYEAIATQLPVIILGTVGTEAIAGVSVRRLASRDLDSLVAAMGDQARSPAPRRRAELQSFAMHPLVDYYRKSLSCH
jgi:glycosyltransferase involved in cell wall biosynthesis